MIDIHCHLLPLVDDGPLSYDESMEMVDMAYENGTRCIIATPHRNHPFEFVASETIEATYKILKERIREKYKDFGIVLGAELYITKDYLEILKSKPFGFTMGETKYVLIEFDRDIKHKDMQSVVHEMMIKGYRPIIAHIEMYPSLAGDIEKIRSIRNEGAYIQITASSIKGKHGNEMKVYLRKLIRLGLVDFVASDGHKIDARRPRLLEAYQAISSILSEKDADRIFKQNPKDLIAGKDIAQPTYAVKSGGCKVVRMNMIAASVAILLISVASLISLIRRDDALSVSNENLAAYTEVVATLGLDESSENESSASTTPSTNNGQSGSSVGLLSPVIPAKEAIENDYHEAMKVLEAQYVSQLEDIVANIKVAKSNISDDVQRKAIIDAYIDEIVTLEQQSDNIVYDLLYKMQNDLEANKYDVAQVGVFRAAYHEVKETKQAKYLSELGHE